MKRQCRFASEQGLVFLSIIVGLLILIGLFGCEPDRKGVATANSAPDVYFANVPPAGANFSRNPEISWYGTDSDGYIVFYRYAVVVDSMLLINGLHVTPDYFSDQASDIQFGWDTLNVDLDHTQTTTTVRLYADVDSPVDSFISQYVFVQACDDRGALSDIIWRRYSRNNHFPNTHFRAQSEFINAVSPSSPAPGISLTWVGVDSIDWGRADPPLEYEWRLYGPFEKDDIIRTEIVNEDCVYDPVADSFVNCREVPLLDLDNLPPAVGNLPQPLMHSQGPNYSNDPSDVWITETETTLYDVYKDLDLTATSQYKFIFWVRTRDDGYLPDPTPSFAQFWVYEAKFENSVMVIDETGYSRSQGIWGPRDIDTVKAYFYNLLHDDLGYDDFDTLYKVGVGPDHFFFSATRRNTEGAVFPIDVSNRNPELIDVLSHRVIIYHSDDVLSGPNETSFGNLSLVFRGLDMGASGWLMSRNMGNAGNFTPRLTDFNMSAGFAYHFGFQSVVCEGWQDGIFTPGPIINFNEEFIGAYSNIQGFPQVMVDYGPGSLLDTRYPRWRMDTSHVMQGQPETGIGTRTQYAAPLFLYLSRHGDKSIFHGKVMSVMQQLGDMRTACFMFTPLAMDPDSMRQVFEIMMPWLSAKFEAGAKSSELDIPGYNTAFSSIPERRARIAEFLRYMSEDATPEERAAYGMGPPPPLVSKPGKIIRQ